MMAKIFFDLEGRRKECSKCGAVKSFDDFYPHKRSRGGYRTSCKACHSLRGKDGYKPMTPRFCDLENRLKECNRCGLVKSFDEFVRSPRLSGGVSGACKVCFRKSKLPYAPRAPRGFFDAERQIRECTKCKLVLPFDDFPKGVTGSRFRGGVNSRCKKCFSDTGRAGHIKRRYGLTPKQYSEMLDSQHGACAICKQVAEKLYIDHCHATGKVRGLLCSLCNSGIGMLGDSAARVDEAAAYLRRNGAA